MARTSLGISELLFILLVASALAFSGCAQHINQNAILLPETIIYRLDEGILLELRLIEHGRFTMGYNEGFDYEKPEHEVEITSSFYLGKYEVTQAQWKAVMGRSIRDQYALAKTNHEKEAWWEEYGKINGEGDNYPIYFINWFEAVEFCKRLSKLTGRKFRLPTEAEYEYAARAGTKTLFFWGIGNPYAEGKKYANVIDISAKRKYGYENIFQGYNDLFPDQSPVDEFYPNTWDIYGVCGNVWEWTADWYSQDYYSKSPLKDPVNTRKSVYKILRGGGLDDIPMYVRYSSRNGKPPDIRYYSYGMRVVMEID